MNIIAAGWRTCYKQLSHKYFSVRRWLSQVRTFILVQIIKVSGRFHKQSNRTWKRRHMCACEPKKSSSAKERYTCATFPVACMRARVWESKSLQNSHTWPSGSNSDKPSTIQKLNQQCIFLMHSWSERTFDWVPFWQYLCEHAFRFKWVLKYLWTKSKLVLVDMRGSQKSSQFICLKQGVQSACSSCYLSKCIEGDNSMPNLAIRLHFVLPDVEYTWFQLTWLLREVVRERKRWGESQSSGMSTAYRQKRRPCN